MVQPIAPANGDCATNSGTWQSNRNDARRDHNKCMNGMLFDRGASRYALGLDDDFYDMFKDVDLNFLPNVQNLDVLVRFSIKVPKWFPVKGSSFTSGLYLHYIITLASGQTLIANSLLKIFSFLEKRFKWLFSQMPNSVNRLVYDDYIRKHLKRISKWAFPKVFSEGPAYCFLMHMDMLGSKSPWTKEMVESDISKWTSGDSGGNLELLQPYMDAIFHEWGFDSNSANFLSFKDFCNDPIRWGTSGGAKKTNIGGETYRSKWAWAFSKLLDNDGRLKPESEIDLYAAAIAEPEVCMVALKEEEKKTREIITTPMASYLRQSYLAYRWNRLPGDSPLSNPSWLGAFQSTQYSWYGCADAERFDHSVTKEMVKYVVRKMGGIDEETEWVARHELESIDRLIIAWNGKEWPYKGGLLSGWRITSLVGTMVSMSIGRYIIEKNNIPGARAVGMGDDIILASPRFGLSRDQLFDSYAETGFNINLLKTISGPIGEFLRQVYSPRGVIGYPASAMGSVLYAPPWLERYSLEKEQEVSKNWLTLYSRYLPHSIDNMGLTTLIRNLIKTDIKQHFKIKGNLDNWLDTPIPAGGGGVVEWSRPAVWCRIESDDNVERKKTSFLSLFGIGEKNVKSSRSSRIVGINMRHVRHDASNMRRVSQEHVYSIPKNVNKTNAFVRFVNDRNYTVSQLERDIHIKLPRGMRTCERVSIIKFLMGVEQNLSAFSSVQTTNDGLGALTRFFKNVYRLASQNRRLSSSADVPAIATLYAQQAFTHVDFVSGSW